VKSAWSALFLIALLLGPFGAARGAEYYGVDSGGSRYAEVAQINAGNVDRLVTAWTYRTGDLARRYAAVLRRSKFEVTPILVDSRLLICTPFNEVIALDPGDGHELWRFDPKIATDYRPANLFTCRGVAFWRDSGGAAGPCATRVLTVTNDARLIALDLETGRRCAGFGQEGEVRIEPGKPLLWPGEGR
jgi:quinoprotein glucose dehydrogenase